MSDMLSLAWVIRFRVWRLLIWEHKSQCWKQSHFLQRGGICLQDQLHGCVTHDPMFKMSLRLCTCSSLAVLKFEQYWTRDSTSSLCTDPTSYVASPDHLSITWALVIHHASVSATLSLLLSFSISTCHSEWLSSPHSGLHLAWPCWLFPVCVLHCPAVFALSTSFLIPTSQERVWDWDY